MTGIDVVGASNGTQDTDAPPGSALARMRAAATIQRQARHLELPVGGAFGDRLVLRYGVLPIEQMDRYADLGSGNVRLSALTIEMMVDACKTALWVEDGTTSDLEVGLTGGLWELMGWPLPPETRPEELTPREIVLALFGGNGMAVVAHAEQLIGWMRDPTEGPPVGESSAATS